MSKYKQVFLNLAILTFLISAGSTSAYDHFGESKNNKVKKNYSAEMVLETFENNDYLSWKKLVGANSSIAKVITKDRFEKFTSTRELARSGKYDEALKSSVELGEELKGVINIFTDKKRHIDEVNKLLA